MIPNGLSRAIMGKRVAILQSNYIPWKGYFDMILRVDEFVLFDEVQFTRRDWRNRNKIKTANGLLWLTIPVKQDDYHQKISETEISDDQWASKHWKTISLNYARSPFFKTYKDIFGDFFHSALPVKLSEVNRKAIELINEILEVKTKITSSSDYTFSEGKNERLISICRQAGASVYLSGPAAKEYVDESLFTNENISVEWMDYSGYKEYPQLFPPFEHGVSVIDLIFNTGPEAIRFITQKESAPYGK